MKCFKLLLITATLCCLFIWSSDGVYAQSFIKEQQKDFFDDYLYYKRWGIHYNRTTYRPAYAKKIEGVYDINPRFMGGFNVGFTYTFRKEKPFSYYTGLDMDFFPFFHFSYSIPSKEFYNGVNYHENNFNKLTSEHNILTIPIGIAWKKKINSNDRGGGLYYHIKGDVRFHIIQPGGMGYTKKNDGIPFFRLFADSKPINILSPSLNLAAGMDLHTQVAIFNININVQKGLVPYLQGGYAFMNLKESPNTIGVYKIRADYIGLDVGITFRKWKHKR